MQSGKEAAWKTKRGCEERKLGKKKLPPQNALRGKRKR